MELSNPQNKSPSHPTNPYLYAYLRVPNSQPEITSSPHIQVYRETNKTTSERQQEPMTMMLTNLRSKTLTAKSTLKGNMQYGHDMNIHNSHKYNQGMS